MAFQKDAFQNDAFQVLLYEDGTTVIFQFVTWLRAQFPAERIYPNERVGVGGQPVPDRCAVVIEGSGVEDATPNNKFGYQMVQIITRDQEAPKARKFAWDIYEYVTSRFGQILPAVVVDGVLYPEIQTGQMSAMARPQSLGKDDEGRTEFVTNFQIYWRRT